MQGSNERQRLIVVEREAWEYCRHEPYHGRCAHCDVPFKDGRPNPPPPPTIVFPTQDGGGA